MVNNPGDRFSELISAFDRFVDLIAIVKLCTNEMTEFEFVGGWSPQRILELCRVVRLLEDEANILQNNIHEFEIYLNRAEFDPSETEFIYNQISTGITQIIGYSSFLQTICDQERPAIVGQRINQLLTRIDLLNTLEQMIPMPDLEPMQRIIIEIRAYRDHCQQVVELFRTSLLATAMTAEDTQRLFHDLQQTIATIRKFIQAILDFLDGLSESE